MNDNETSPDRNESRFRSILRSVALVLSFALWLASLALPALISPNPDNTLWGVGILLMGWLGVIGVQDGISALGALAWWANPLYLWALLKTFGGRKAKYSPNMALGLATLTVLLGSYAVNVVPSFAPVQGYGPGALLWYLSIVCLSYVVAGDSGNHAKQKFLVGLGCTVCIIFVGMVEWRAMSANPSERDGLPFYAAKRGAICSTRAVPLPISTPQPAIAVEDKKRWLGYVHSLGIAVIQVGSTEYFEALPGSWESKQPPYMDYRPVTVPARYTLRVESDNPEYRDTNLVLMTVIDNHTKQPIGHLAHHRQINRRLGYCPSFDTFPRVGNEEVRQWLAPFIAKQTPHGR